MAIVIIILLSLVLVSLICKKNEKKIDLTSGFVNPTVKDDIFNVKERIEDFGKKLIDSSFMTTEEKTIIDAK